MSRFTGPGLDGSPIGVARIDFVGNTAPLQQAATQAKEQVRQVNAEINKAPPATSAGATTGDGPVGIGGLGKRLKDTVGPLKMFQSAITSTVGIFSGFIASAGLVVSAIAAIGNHFLQAERRAVSAGLAFSKAIRDTERAGAERASEISREGIEDAARALDGLSEKYLEIRQKVAQDDKLNFDQRQKLMRQTYEDENNEAKILRDRIARLEGDAAQRSREASRRAIEERERLEDEAERRRIEKRREARQKLIDDELDMEKRKNQEIQKMERELQNALVNIRSAASGSVQNETFYQLDAIRQAVEVIRQQNPGSLVG